MNLELPVGYDSSRPPVELLVPSSHHHLGIVRLFLPYEYRDQKSETTRIVRWSELELARSGTTEVAVDEEFFSYIFPVMDEFKGNFSHKDDDPGLLDSQTLAALNDASRPFGRLHGFHFSDLDAAPKVEERVEIHGSIYDRYKFTGGKIDPKRRLPQFVIDENAQFAWGANLYPDSLLIAAPGYICDRLLSDPRVDCALVAHSLPNGPDVDFHPVSSNARKPHRRTITTLEMNPEDLLALLEKCVFPGGENQPQDGTRQKGVRMQALGGAIVASAALVNAHVQAIATPKYVDPELDIFIKYRDLKAVMKNLKKLYETQTVRILQRVPTELGLAPRSSESAIISSSEASSCSNSRHDLNLSFLLSDNQNPDMSRSFLATEPSPDSCPFEVSTYYIDWIISIFNHPLNQFSDAIQLEASVETEHRTIVTVANNWRISYVADNEGSSN